MLEQAAPKTKGSALTSIRLVWCARCHEGVQAVHGLHLDSCLA